MKFGYVVKGLVYQTPSVIKDKIFGIESYTEKRLSKLVVELHRKVQNAECGGSHFPVLGKLCIVRHQIEELPGFRSDNLGVTDKATLYAELRELKDKGIFEALVSEDTKVVDEALNAIEPKIKGPSEKSRQKWHEQLTAHGAEIERADGLVVINLDNYTFP